MIKSNSALPSDAPVQFSSAFLSSAIAAAAQSRQQQGLVRQPSSMGGSSSTTTAESPATSGVNTRLASVADNSTSHTTHIIGVLDAGSDATVHASTIINSSLSGDYSYIPKKS
jgi:hypothetical protein